MSAFVLNPRKSHREQLLAMVNHYNQSTIGDQLSLANTLIGTRSASAEELADTAVRLTNSKYANDFVDINYNRLDLAAFVNMTEADGDFSWYTPDTWDPETSPAQAVAALKAAATRQNVDLDLSADSVAITRAFDNELNRYKLVVAIGSYVWKDSVEYVMPRHFSEEITVTELNGINYSAITAESVVD